jgi:hypothetical protein
MAECMKQRSSGAYRGAAGPVRRERASGARGRRDGGRRKPAREERGRLRRGLVLGFWEEEEPGAGRKMLAVAVAGEKRREVVVVVVPPWWVECVIVAWLGGVWRKLILALHCMSPACHSVICCAESTSSFCTSFSASPALVIFFLENTGIFQYFGCGRISFTMQKLCNCILGCT